jgi:hypothetical protein
MVLLKKSLAARKAAKNEFRIKKNGRPKAPVQHPNWFRKPN